MSDADVDEWQQRADELHEHGGVPEQRAKVVALRERGDTYGEIAATLGFGSNDDDRSQVKRHLDSYQEQRDDAGWLVENGPDEEDIQA